MLTGDFFELLEKLLKGVVYFLYNIVVTVVAILRQPVLGGYRLQRIYEDPRQRQLGGLSFLFLSFVAFYALILPGIDASAERLAVVDAASPVADALAEGPNLDFGGLWPSIAAALTSVLIIDATLRVALWWRLPNRRRRRERIGAAVEFALFIALLAYSIAFGLAAAFIRELLFEEWATYAALALLVPTLVLPCYPAGVALSAGFRRGRPPRRPRLRAALAAGAVVMLLTVALVAGHTVGSGIGETRESKSYVRRGPAVTTLDCKLGRQGDLRVLALFEVENSGPAAIDARRLFLTVNGSALGRPAEKAVDYPQDLAWEDTGSGDYLLVTPDAPRLAWLRTTVRPGDWRTCQLGGGDGSHKGDAATVRREPPSRTGPAN